MLKKFLTTGIMTLALTSTSLSPALASGTAVNNESNFSYSSEVLHHAETASNFASYPAGREKKFSPRASFQVTSVQPNTRMPQVLVSCRNPGGTCTLSKTVTQAATISGGGGISFSVLNANLGGGFSASVELGVSCESPKLGYGQVFNAYPMGTFVIFKYNGQSGTAFLPTGVACQVDAG